MLEVYNYLDVKKTIAPIVNSHGITVSVYEWQFGLVIERVTQGTSQYHEFLTFSEAIVDLRKSLIGLKERIIQCIDWEIENHLSSSDILARAGELSLGTFDKDSKSTSELKEELVDYLGRGFDPLIARLTLLKEKGDDFSKNLAGKYKKLV